MSIAINDYLLSVFTYENLTTLCDADQVFRRKEYERLTNIKIRSHQVIQEIDKLRINKSPVGEVFPRVLKNVRTQLV